MQLPRPFAPRGRRGMTLIELGVVMVILVTLVTLVGVYVVPAFRDNKNVLRGLDRVVTALLIAKQRALRDQGPRGVRFLVQADGTCNEVQYIEEPEAYRTGTISPGQQADQVLFTFAQGSGSDLYGGAPQGNVTEYLVQPGDFLRVEVGTPSTYLITAVPANNVIQVSRAINPAIPAGGTKNFRVIRQARPLVGEDTVKMPQNVVIDLGHITTISPANQVTTRQVPGGQPNQLYYEVLFAPTGSVMNRTSAAIVIWGRAADAVPATKDPNVNYLIGINSRTGGVATHPVDNLGPDPTAWAKDGKSSGM